MLGSNLLLLFFITFENIQSTKTIEVKIPESLITSPKLSSENLLQLEKDFVEALVNRDIEEADAYLILNCIVPLFNNQKIKLRKYKKYCRSCIITDAQVDEMASMLYLSWLKDKKQDEDEHYPASFEELNKTDKKRFYELIFIIPVAFKKLGFELYREAEDAFINEALAEHLARIIHSRFNKHMLDETNADVYNRLYLVSGSKDIYEKEFDELPDDIKEANIDNAYHIPTKLLSIGYQMQPVEEGVLPPLLKLTDNQVEIMSMMEHDRWGWERRLNGWTYNMIRNNELKHHNCLMPYDELPPYEQEKDRIMVRFIPALLVDIGYKAVKVSPELANEISYINQQSGYIYEAETQIRNLHALLIHQNDEIQDQFDKRFGDIESINELKDQIKSFHKYLSKQYLHSSLQRIETTNELLKNIKGAFKSGKNIQRTFMPNAFDLKEYFPESFVLFKPKDVVSGDFYFIAKQNNMVIFCAADCTGHGISGSILSGICYNYLHEAVYDKAFEHPIDILSYTMPKVREMLKHSNSLVHGNSEMELALCGINSDTQELEVASYGRPVYAFLNGELTQLGKGCKLNDTKEQDGFYFQQVKLHKGDTVYTCSDGYADQLGGPDGRKFMTKHLKELLSDIQPLKMYEQCQVLNNEIDDWRMCEGKYQGNPNSVQEDQTDDISIVAVRI